MKNFGTHANTWRYDAFGRLASIPGMITSQTYEAEGQTKAITYANGVTTSFTYSPTRRWVESVVTKNASGVELVASRYTRDLTGRITAVNGAAPADNWTACPSLKLGAFIA